MPGGTPIIEAQGFAAARCLGVLVITLVISLGHDIVPSASSINIMIKSLTPLKGVSG